MDDPAYRLAASRLFLAQEDVTAIEALARPLAPGACVVDLGAGSGTTALAVFCANPAVRVYTVDRDYDALVWAQRNVQPYFPDVAHVTILSDADRAEGIVLAYDVPDVDLLLHDAGHSYNDVHRDLIAWWPKLKPGAYVWVHDFGSPPWGGGSYPEVAQAVEALVVAGHYDDVAITGMGWIGRKPDAS